MEPNPRSFIVGLFVLILTIAGVGFVIWYSKIDIRGDESLYQINFTGAVTGLRQNEAVLYQGIPIGRVEKIKIDKSDVESVKVIVSIDKPSLIRENSVATIEAQGLTGLTFVQIKGSTQESPILKTQPGEKYPVIQSEPSPIEALFTEAPKILKKLSSVTVQLEKFFSDQMITDTQKSMVAFRKVVEKLSTGPESLDKLVQDFRRSLKHITTASDLVSEVLESNRDAIEDFSNRGLPAFTRAMQSFEHSSDAFGRIARDLEKGPGHFIHKNANQGVSLENEPS